MKPLQIISYIGVAALIGLGVTMAVTNPDKQDYEEYAVQKLTAYLKDEVCPQAPNVFGNFLRRNCTVVVDVSRPQIQQIITETTQQRNLIFFSIYSTDLELNPVIPAYHFETIGVWQNFYTYTAKKQ